MSDKNGRLPITDLRQGINGVDAPQRVADTQCVSAINIDFYGSPLGAKRAGVEAQTLTSSPFTAKISSLFRHVPGIDETVAELWGVDAAATPNIGRLTGGTAWATPTLKDVPTGNGWDVTFASLNGLLFIAYKSAVDRLHVWDPVSNSVRRTGLAQAGGTAAADTGVGTYPAVLRYYRMRWTEQRAGITVRRSETLGTAATAFTPSGSGLAARVTQAGVISEGETHWEIEASTDNAIFYRIATVAVGTTTYDDSALVATYASNPLSATAGFYSLQRSYRFIAADQGRVLGFGMFTSTNPQSRVEFSAVIGSSDVGDAERVPTGNYKGLDENDSGVPTGLCGPVDGSFFAFKYRQFWKGTPTGDATQPYTWVALDKTAGAVGPKAITVGEDERGNAAIYFMSYLGPYRYGTQGKEYLGKHVEHLTIGNAADAGGGTITTLDLESTTVACHALWYPAKRQVWLWCSQMTLSSGVSTRSIDPTYVLVYGVGRSGLAQAGFSGTYEASQPSGWTTFQSPVAGGLGNARCSVLFANTIAAAMSRDLKPYAGMTTGNNVLGKCDTGTQDLGVNYLARFTTKVYAPWGDDYEGTIAGGQLVAVAASGVSVTVTTFANFQPLIAQSVTSSVSLTPAGTEAFVKPRIGGDVAWSNVQWVQWQVGEVAVANTTWRLTELHFTWARGAPVVA